MGYFHIHRKRSHTHHKLIQTHQHKNNIPHQQHHPETPYPQPQHERHILRVRVYKLTCPECNKAYVGQTDRSFSQHYWKHLRAFKHDYHSSSFALHLTEQKHPFGPINEIMLILHLQGKSTHMNALERFYIHKETLNNNQLNDNIPSSPTRSLTPFLTMTLNPHRHSLPLPATPDCNHHTPHHRVSNQDRNPVPPFFAPHLIT
jgi:hypothetical protein